MFHLSPFSENLMSFLGWILEVLSALSISILTHVMLGARHSQDAGIVHHMWRSFSEIIFTPSSV